MLYMVRDKSINTDSSTYFDGWSCSLSPLTVCKVLAVAVVEGVVVVVLQLAMNSVILVDLTFSLQNLTRRWWNALDRVNFFLLSKTIFEQNWYLFVLTTSGYLIIRRRLDWYLNG